MAKRRVSLADRVMDASALAEQFQLVLAELVEDFSDLDLDDPEAVLRGERRVETRLQRMIRTMVNEAEKGSLAHAQLVLDRAFGKPRGGSDDTVQHRHTFEQAIRDMHEQDRQYVTSSVAVQPVQDADAAGTQHEPDAVAALVWAEPVDV